MDDRGWKRNTNCILIVERRTPVVLLF